MKNALITGITGQSGSYLAEILLEKGYKIVGLKRRTSTINTSRIDHLYDRFMFSLKYWDSDDPLSLVRIIDEVGPDEIYNLSAQSHVKVSFELPEHTFNSVAISTLRLLETITYCRYPIKLYQASSSEQFGSSPPPQNEDTKFDPQSPYAIAKTAGYHLIKNYRNAYNVFASNGILFNHECFTFETPVLIKQNGLIDICYMSDIVPFSPFGEKTQTFDISKNNLEILDKNGEFTRILTASANKFDYSSKDYIIRRIVTHSGTLRTTSNHKYILEDSSEKEAKNLTESSKLLVSKFPLETKKYTFDDDVAWLAGFFIAEGSVGGRNSITFTCNDVKYIDKCVKILEKYNYKCKKYYSKSGFNAAKLVLKMDASLPHDNDITIGNWFNTSCLTKDRKKKIPKEILNADKKTIEKFIEGYYCGDGTKSLGKRGLAKDYCAFKTNSPVLMLGLNYLFSIIGYEVRQYGEGGFHYCANIHNTSSTPTNKGKHLIVPKNKVKRIRETIKYNSWVFDLETESGTLVAGTGLIVVHNSPRRGETFVSKKITQAIAKIKKGKQDCLTLGNLYAKRDWGHAKDYMNAVYLVLQYDKPDDFVIATGESHTIKEFCDLACKFADIEIEWSGKGINEVGVDKKTGKTIIRVSERYFRPTEVDSLCGDSTKARRELNWKPSYTFESLVQEMIEYDLNNDCPF